MQIQSETIKMKVTIKYTKLQSATTRPTNFILNCIVERSMTLQPSNSPLSHGGHIVPGDQKSFVLPR